MAAPTPSIEKLQKKLEKEPNSLIFLQLAEEYRKESLYVDALRTCRDGLRRHPNYWSARVAMGRIYREMGDQEKAREELEKVTKAVPDNLLANKLLGDIYMESGRMADALKRYQIVQMLTPNDQEVIANLQRIEAQLMPPVLPGAAQAPQAAAAPAPTVEMPSPAAPVEPAQPPPLEIPSFLEKTEPGLRAGSLESLDATMPQDAQPVAPAAPEEPGLGADLAAMFMESAQSTEIPVAPAFPSTEEERFPAYAPAQAEMQSAGPPAAEQQLRSEDRTQPIQEKQEKEEPGEFEGDELTTQTLAELYVQQGLTDKAVKVFQKLLLNDPGNSQILQRLRELSPADELLSVAASPTREQASGRGPREVQRAPSGARVDQQAEERQRKITTLENWLAAIRRERP